MWSRLKRSEFEKMKGDGNKQALKNMVKAGYVPGIIAYSEQAPIAWCSIGPRGDFGALSRSRIMKPLDDQAVWSIMCLFVAKHHRQQGVSVELLSQAVRYAKRCGAKIVEGYPVEPKTNELAPVFAYLGLASAFRQARFVEMERRSPTRPFMRYVIANMDE